MDLENLEYEELIKQEYAGNNCKFSAGFVYGNDKPKEDTVYLRLEKDEEEPTVILLTPDEMQSIAWLCTGTIWSYLYKERK